MEDFQVPDLELDNSESVLWADSFIGAKDPVLKPPHVAFVESSADEAAFAGLQNSPVHFKWPQSQLLESDKSFEFPPSNQFDYGDDWQESFQDLSEYLQLESPFPSFSFGEADADIGSLKTPEQIVLEIQAEAEELTRLSPDPLALATATADIQPEDVDIISVSEDSLLMAWESVGEEVMETRRIRPSPARVKKPGRWPNSPMQERKERKKQQNREAAARYRMKKMHQKEGTRSEADELDAMNVELREKVKGLEFEIDYLKSLMSEIRARSATKS